MQWQWQWPGRGESWSYSDGVAGVGTCWHIHAHTRTHTYALTGCILLTSFWVFTRSVVYSFGFQLSLSFANWCWALLADAVVAVAVAFGWQCCFVCWLLLLPSCQLPVSVFFFVLLLSSSVCSHVLWLVYVLFSYPQSEFHIRKRHSFCPL